MSIFTAFKFKSATQIQISLSTDDAKNIQVILKVVPKCIEWAAQWVSCSVPVGTVSSVCVFSRCNC